MPRNPGKLKKRKDVAKEEGEGRANPFKTEKDADDDGGCGRGRKGRADEQEESEDERRSIPPAERDEVSEPNWGSGSNGGDASPSESCGSTDDEADAGDLKRRSPSAMAEATTYATWKDYVPGPNADNGRWYCPACERSCKTEGGLQNHVWTLAGQEGHPTEKEQTEWWKNHPKKGKKRK